MPTPKSQIRPVLSSTVQQMAATEASALVGLKVAFHTVASSMSAETDFAACDATAGAFQLALPSVADAYVGKPYYIKETSGAADVTLTTPGSETINGSATLVVTAGSVACVVLTESAAGVRSWESLISSSTALGAGSVGSTELASASVQPVHLAQVAITAAADAAVAILANTTEVNVSTASGANTAITTTAAEPGQMIRFRMSAAAGGGSYTLATSAGTLTLNAANEVALVRRNTADDAWDVVSLIGATIL